MSQLDKVSRRRFLKSGTALAAGALAMTARSHARVVGANERLNLAIIGCGHIANTEHMKALLPMLEKKEIGILACCDVYRTRAEAMQVRLKEVGADPRIFVEHQDVLDLPDVDYVLFATPEHWHAQHTIDALRAGKHVYCEKPMTHTPDEAKAVLAEVAKTDLKLQIGVQGMSDESYARAHDAIKAGRLGPVVEAQIEYCRNYDINLGPWRKEDTDPAMALPADLDWKRWLGPAPERPWDPHRYFEWRNYRDYSGGIGTDLFIHRISRIIRACGLDMPTRVAGMGGIYLWPDGRELPDSLEMIAEYPPVEGISPGMTVHVLGTMANRYRLDHCIRGHKATLVFIRNKGWQIIEGGPGGKVIEEFSQKLEHEASLHHKNLHAAIRGEAELNCPPELGFRALVPVWMANESCFTSKTLRWDASSKKAIPT
jgi:predicted dehydrogenase